MVSCLFILASLGHFRGCRHWGQGVNYPVGPWWVHSGFWNNSPNFYPVGKGWVFFKSTHQSTHWVTLWKNPVGSLRISYKKCPSCAWATHCGFFQKVPINLIKKYPLGLFQCNQRESSIWFNFPTNSQRTQWVYGWVHCGQIDGYFLKEPFVSGSGTWWALFEWNSQRTQWVLSKSYPVGTLVGTFEKYPPLTHWVKVGRIVSEPTMYSPWTHWVIDPLPPVGTLWWGLRSVGSS